MRDKSRELAELVENPTQLKIERELSRNTTSNREYLGFGSDDINRLGYNKEG